MGKQSAQIGESLEIDNTEGKFLSHIYSVDRRVIIAKLRKTNEEFQQEVREKNKYVEVLEPYKGCNIHLKCKCKSCGYEWKMTPSNLIRGRGCPECRGSQIGNRLRKTHDAFVDEMSGINPDIILLGKYKGAFEPIECKCIKHNNIFFSSPTHLLNGKTGCSKCRSEKISISLMKSHNDFVDDLHVINPSIKVIGDYVGSGKRILVKCLKCNHEWTPQAGSLLCGTGCPKCCYSKGEERISNYLKSNSIDYELHYWFDDLRGIGGKKHLPLSYDFYLPEYNMLIEYQGQFHDNTAPQQTDEQFEVQKEHDRLKKEYALSHDYNFLEIWYWNYKNIEQIITEYINDLKNPVTTTVA